jgi:hypothetical protein
VVLLQPAGGGTTLCSTLDLSKGLIMKLGVDNVRLLLAGVFLSGVAVFSFANQAPPATPAKGELLHVVSLKFKEGATKEQIKAVEDAFGALPSKIPGIASYKWGTNVSPEKHDKGFTHCFILGFKSEKDRDDYLVHPDHKAFGKTLGPVFGDVFVIDFWAQGETK